MWLQLPLCDVSNNPVYYQGLWSRVSSSEQGQTLTLCYLFTTDQNQLVLLYVASQQHAGLCSVAVLIWDLRKWKPAKTCITHLNSFFYIGSLTIQAPWNKKTWLPLSVVLGWLLPCELISSRTPARFWFWNLLHKFKSSMKQKNDNSRVTSWGKLARLQVSWFSLKFTRIKVKGVTLISSSEEDADAA